MDIPSNSKYNNLINRFQKIQEIENITEITRSLMSVSFTFMAQKPCQTITKTVQLLMEIPSASTRASSTACAEGINKTV